VSATDPLVEVSRPIAGKSFNSDTRKVLWLSWPIALALLGDTAMGLVDTKLVSALGKDAVGGVGIAVMIMYLAYSLVSGTMRGVKVNTAFAVGEGAKERGLDYAWAGVISALSAGTVIWAVSRDIGYLLREVCRDFFAAVTWGAPGACVQHALIQYRQGMGDSRVPTAVQIAGNVVNAGLAYTLVYGKFGCHRYGAAGAGYATALVVTFNAVILAALFLRHVPAPKPLWQAFLAVLQTGLPTGIQFAAEMVAMVAFTVVLGGIAPAQIAGHQVALMIMRTSFLPGVAVGEACSVLVGQALGAGDVESAKRSTQAALRIAILFMTACGVVFAVFGARLAALFAPDQDVRSVIVRLLLIAAAFQIPDAVNVVLRGALRGAKDAKIPARISVLCVWLFIPSSAYLFGKVLGLGAQGGWLGFVLETFTAALLLWRRWRKAVWSLPRPHNT
jgi:multidrug resistance protein, MATE family